MRSFDPTYADPELPHVDDHLVEPETPYEMYDGELVRVPPADEPHAEQHVKVCVLVAAHVRPEYAVGADLLTRTSKVDDIAPDVNVYPRARDPVTGRRQLQLLAIEVVSTQTLSNAARKAGKLAGRGVRRVFAIDVERERALEWSTALAGWMVLDVTSHIDDPVFEVPLPIGALVSAAISDNAVAAALIRRHNPIIDATKAESRAEGKLEGRAEGMRESVFVLLAVRGIPVSVAARARIDAEQDLELLRGWLARAAGCASVDELFSVPPGHA